MTLILALDCAEGLILASDGQQTISTNGQEMKQPTKKLYASWTNVAWGASGNAGMIQRVQQNLMHRFPKPDAFETTHTNDIRKKLSLAIAETVRPILQNQVINVPGMSHPLVSFVFAGCSGGRPFLLEVHPNLSDTDHIDTGFVANGSGDIFPYFALAGLAHFEVRKRSLREARAIAHRVMNDAIAVAAYGLGPPIQMIEITKPSGGAGVVRQLSEEELGAIEQNVVLWKSLESETLAEVLGISTLTISTPDKASSDLHPDV